MSDQVSETTTTRRPVGRPRNETPPDAARAVVYLTSDLVARIKAHQDRMRAERPQVPVSFGSALRTLAAERLAEVEGDAATSGSTT